jgi:hypothetical protein
MIPPTSPLRPDAIRPLVQDSLPWSPLDFIRDVSADGDRQVQFDGLLRALDPANDLRFVVPISRDTEVAVFAERLPWDSAFFGYEVARLQGVFPLGAGRYSHDADYQPAITALLDLARTRGIRYLVAMVAADVSRADGAAVHADRDTLVLLQPASRVRLSQAVPLPRCHPG